MAEPNTPVLIPLLRSRGMSEDAVDRVFSTFTVADTHPGRREP